MQYIATSILDGEIYYIYKFGKDFVHASTNKKNAIIFTEQDELYTYIQKNLIKSWSLKQIQSIIYE